MSGAIDGRTGLAVPPATLIARIAGPSIIGIVLVMLIVPLSPAAISFMFALNISTGLVILAASIYIPRPSDFLAFPSVLLGTTLMRLALNVATARAILLRGYTGTDAAGRVIEAFGNFVVGGNYVVGFIIFGILIIINFTVVTKGSSRVAEVSARFTLDSLPGRQMAIEADVNAGTLTVAGAMVRREELRRDADFFGAMDGASKFVRGDVIAAMIILAINLVGGLLIGTLQHGLSIAVAAHNYTLLTVGDGVAAQIPSLCISVASGLVVTRVATGEDIGSQIIGQISNYPQALLVASCMLILLGLMPGMAHAPFLFFGIGLGMIAWRMNNQKKAQALAPAPPVAQETQKSTGETASEVSGVDPFGLEIGFALVDLLSESTDGKPTLLARMTSVRQRYGKQMGFVVPNIYIRDTAAIRPQGYRFTIRGAPVAAGEVRPNSWLAIETPQVQAKFTKGNRTTDPTFGQPAIWVSKADLREVESLGYTVADPSGVIATHLAEVLNRHAWELLGRQELEQLLANLAKLSPKLTEELRNRHSLGLIRQILQWLLMEDVPIKDMALIAEAMVDVAEPVGKDPERLLAAVRMRLSRTITARFQGADQVIKVSVLDPELESLVGRAVKTAQANGLGMVVEPETAKLLRQAGQNAANAMKEKKAVPALAVQSDIRRAVQRCLARTTAVISVDEIPENAPLTIIPTGRQIGSNGHVPASS
jgi:flagellar biosynthesis protein FlhA